MIVPVLLLGTTGLTPVPPLRPLPSLSPRLAMSDGGGQGWWQSLFAEEPAASPLAEATVREICREDGWLVKCVVGPTIARQLGGTGSLARRGGGTDVRLDFSVAFAQEVGYDPPQGTVRLLGESKLLSTSTAEEEAALAPPGERPQVAKGFWSVDKTDEFDVPTAVRWRLQCAGISSGGEEVVAAGQLYFNALVGQRRPSAAAATSIVLSDGRVTVKEDIGVNAIFQARGILAEYKVVGSFDVIPRLP